MSRRRYLVAAGLVAVAAGAAVGLVLLLGGGKSEPTRSEYLARVTAKAVRPPSELRHDVGTMFKLSDRAVGELASARRAALEGHVRESALAVGRFLEVSDEAHAIALRIGLDCQEGLLPRSRVGR